MIGWLFDRCWAWKNRAALQQLDGEMDALQLEAERLERRMLEEYGPNWRAEAEERLRRAFNGTFTTT